MAKHKLTAEKAGKMIKEDGKKYTPKALRYFGWVRGGRKPRPK